jgi:hypothetical protein
VEDDETPEMIMRKFEALDRLVAQAKRSKPTKGELGAADLVPAAAAVESDKENVVHSGPAPAPLQQQQSDTNAADEQEEEQEQQQEEPPLDESILVQVFKRTSRYSNGSGSGRGEPGAAGGSAGVTRGDARAVQAMPLAVQAYMEAARSAHHQGVAALLHSSDDPIMSDEDEELGLWGNIWSDEEAEDIAHSVDGKRAGGKPQGGKKSNQRRRGSSGPASAAAAAAAAGPLLAASEGMTAAGNGAVISVARGGSAAARERNTSQQVTQRSMSRARVIWHIRRSVHTRARALQRNTACVPGCGAGGHAAQQGLAGSSKAQAATGWP